MGGHGDCDSARSAESTAAQDLLRRRLPAWTVVHVTSLAELADQPAPTRAGVDLSVLLPAAKPSPPRCPTVGTTIRQTNAISNDPDQKAYRRGSRPLRCRVLGGGSRSPEAGPVSRVPARGPPVGATVLWIVDGSLAPVRDRDSIGRQMLDSVSSDRSLPRSGQCRSHLRAHRPVAPGLRG